MKDLKEYAYILTGDCELQQLRLMNDLSLGTNAEEHRLADKLAACSRGRRCNSPACLSCRRKLRRSLSKKISARLLTHVKELELPLVRFHAQLPSEIYPAGKLHELDMQSLTNRIRLAHENIVALPVVLSAIDISFDEVNFPQSPGCWTTHVECVVVGASRRLLRWALGDIYPLSGAAIATGAPRSLPSAVRMALTENFTSLYKGSAENRRKLATYLDRYDMSALYSLNGCHMEDGEIVLEAFDRLDEIARERRKPK